MSFPYSRRSFGGQIPRHEPTFGVGAEKTGVALNEMYSMDLGRVASEDKRRLSGKQELG